MPAEMGAQPRLKAGLRQAGRGRIPQANAQLRLQSARDFKTLWPRIARDLRFQAREAGLRRRELAPHTRGQAPKSV